MLVFVLVACQSAATEAPDQGSQAEAATDLPPLPDVSPTPLDGDTEVQAEANCTVVSSQPTPDSAEQSLVPPVDSTDWAHGPEDAKVTIIEYGDFQ
jgi:hypothetical protein